MLSFDNDTAPQSFCRSFIALSMIRFSKSAQQSAVQVCQVATVNCCYGNHAAGSKLILKTFYCSQWRIKKGISVPKIISEYYELVKLRDINCSGPGFFETHCIYAIFGCTILFLNSSVNTIT